MIKFLMAIGVLIAAYIIDKWVKRNDD